MVQLTVHAPGVETALFFYIQYPGLMYTVNLVFRVKPVTTAHTSHAYAHVWDIQTRCLNSVLCSLAYLGPL